MSTMDPAFVRGTSHPTLLKLLLACGILYGVLYVVANDVVAAALYQGYSRMSQAISELSATRAPSRAFLTALLPVFFLLLIAFGIGVWKSSRGNRSLRVTGGLVIGLAIAGILWLPFPMTSREDMTGGPMTVNDIGHIVMSAVTVTCILLQMGFSAAVLGKGFRIYTIASAVVLILFTGVLTGIGGAKLAAGEPTPWVGLYERIGLGAWLLWMAALALKLWIRNDRPAAATPRDLAGTS